MIQFVLETEQQQGFSAIPCTNPDSFGARIDTSQPLTEFREGDLYFCLEEREVAVQGKKVDLSVREFNALYLLLMNRRRVMTFETIAYHVWSEEYVENELTAIHNHNESAAAKTQNIPGHSRLYYQCARCWI